jgi:formylglycine-generating enzyme required for sulfatase activity
MRYVPVGIPTILDEQATADRIADTGVWQPVLQPKQELWLEVALIFDQSPSMCLWGRFWQDLRQLLCRYGQFRDVRLWELQYQTPGTVNLCSRSGTCHNPRELLTGDRRRLIVIVSDCVASPWHDGRMRDLIEIWAETLPTVLFQVFPEQLWHRTALARAIAVELQGQQPGLPSNGLIPTTRSYWDQERLQHIQAVVPIVPIVTIEPDSLSDLARVVAGNRQARISGIAWGASIATRSSTQSLVSQKRDRVDTFLLTASPTARELAALLAAAPVITLPIVRLIQQAMLPESNSAHVAEVFMSGLLKVSNGHKPTFKNAEQILYHLADDSVRHRLLAGWPSIDRLIVIERVSNYVAKGLGKSMEQFKALLRTQVTDSLTSPETAEFFGAFAIVTAKVLRGLGGEFVAIANRLTPPTVDLPPENPSESDFPPLQTFEYEFGEITNILEPIEFESATIGRETVEKTSGFGLRRETKQEWVIRRSRRATWGYTEPLNNEINLEMILIPGGSFLMGAPEHEPESFDRERPQHQVTLKPFYMGRYAVTLAQWRVVAGYPQIERELNPNPSRFKGDNRPVENVSWDDATEFCQRLSAQTGRQYKLPSEAQWEYACRAGTTTPFHFGETITTDLANYRGTDDSKLKWSGSYGLGPKGEYREQTTDVGSFPANVWGLHDMHGNVWEWCLDDWHPNYEGAPDDGTAWIDSNRANTNRELRGGSWDDDPRSCRSACRLYYFPRDGFIYIVGFRVVCVVPRTLLSP